MDDRRREGALEGLVQSVRFSNPETFWTVLTLRTSSGDVAVCGTLPGLVDGMNVRVEGRWEENPRFGRQYRADRFTEIVPATLEGLERYLASGFVRGIGDKLARRIVQEFGTDTLEVITRSPERLSAVPGLGKKRAQALTETLRERRAPQDALVFLLGLQIPRGLALRILRRYGDETVAAVRKNPYKLAQEVHGIGFIKADQVARGLDIKNDNPERIRAALIHVLREARDEGHVRLRRDVLLERARALLDISDTKADPLAPIAAILDELVHDGRLIAQPGREPDETHLYLPSLHDAERGVAWHLARLVERSPKRDPDRALPRVDAAAEALGIALAPGQRHAVALALTEPVCIVTGGPGTGKTTIIRTLIEATHLPPARIALAAPTGRAAKRMAEATGRAASTIHRLLELAPHEGTFQRDELDPLATDLVIVDECSMVDLPLFYALVRAVPDKARLVLVGDRDQLPPVGPGSPLNDLIDSSRLPVARLSEIFRQGKGSAIVEAAHAINAGQPLAPTPSGQALSDFYFVQRDEPEQIRALIESLVSERIPERFGLDPLRDVQVLTPMRTGPIGVDALNERLQALLNPPPPPPPSAPFALESAPSSAPAQRAAPFRVGDKVMQIKNDYERGVFNGDIGFVRRVAHDEVQVEVDERLVTYDRDSLDNLVLAYAVTVHKSQGSEYPAIVMPCSTHHFKMLRRNLLYTGVTRGKRLVVLVGTERAMRIAVGNSLVEERNSGLVDVVALALSEGRERLDFNPRAARAGAGDDLDQDAEASGRATNLDDDAPAPPKARG